MNGSKVQVGTPNWSQPERPARESWLMLSLEPLPRPSIGRDLDPLCHVQGAGQESLIGWKGSLS
jgi:hypothetical protein